MRVQKRAVSEKLAYCETELVFYLITSTSPELDIVSIYKVIVLWLLHDRVLRIGGRPDTARKIWLVKCPPSLS